MRVDFSAVLVVKTSLAPSSMQQISVRPLRQAYNPDKTGEKKEQVTGCDNLPFLFACSNGFIAYA
jgi:hypothetical protein